MAEKTPVTSDGVLGPADNHQQQHQPLFQFSHPATTVNVSQSSHHHQQQQQLTSLPAGGSIVVACGPPVLPNNSASISTPGTTTLRTIQLPPGYDVATSAATSTASTAGGQYSMVYLSYPPGAAGLVATATGDHQQLVAVHPSVTTTTAQLQQSNMPSSAPTGLILTTNQLAGATQLLQPHQLPPHLAQQSISMLSTSHATPSSMAGGTTLSALPLNMTTAVASNLLQQHQAQHPQQHTQTLVLPMPQAALALSSPTTAHGGNQQRPVIVQQADSSSTVGGVGVVNGGGVGSMGAQASSIHKCEICGRSFRMRCRLMAHKRRHTGERPFPCEECGRRFSERGNLQRHRDTHSKERRFQCATCGKQFRQASCLSNHRRFHCAGATGRSCPYCTRTFRSASSLHMHIRWKHREAVPLAQIASKVTDKVANNNDTNGETGENYGQQKLMVVQQATGQHNLQHGLQIQQLPQSLSHNNMMTLTTTSVNNNGLNNNSIVDSTFSSNVADVIASMDFSNHLLHPITAVSVASSVSANHADVGQNNTIQMQQLPTRVNKLDKYEPCDDQDMKPDILTANGAGRPARSSSPAPDDEEDDFKPSVTTPTTAGRRRDFHCSNCTRSFFFQCRLAAHMRSHTNIRPYACPECNRTFTQKGYLARHAAVHSTDRPFTCEVCDRSYKHYGSLVNHRRAHRGAAGATETPHSSSGATLVVKLEQQNVPQPLPLPSQQHINVVDMFAATGGIVESVGGVGGGEEDQPTLHLLQPPPSFLIPTSFFVPQA